MGVLEIVASGALVITSILVMVESLRLPVRENFWVSAGSFPFLVATVLLLLGAVWLINSGRAFGSRSIRNEVTTLLRPLAARQGALMRGAGMMVACLVYVYLLIPLLRFTAATILFLIITLRGFAKLSLVSSAVVSFLVTGLVYSAFRFVLMLPLP